MASYARVVAGCGFKGPPIPNTQEEKSSSENDEAANIANDFFSLIESPSYSLSDYRSILERIRSNKILRNFIFSSLFSLFFEKRFNKKLTQEQFNVRFKPIQS